MGTYPGKKSDIHRCGLTNEDLNRKWKSPHPLLHPEIFHTKGLIEFCTRVLKKTPYFYCDFHGHSLKKNIFLYGCSSQESWLSSDKCRVENQVEFRMLSRLLEQCALSFDPKSSHYKIERSKESTARITIWREYGVVRSYTMESTYCGFDQGSFKDTHINISHLRETGASVQNPGYDPNPTFRFEDFCRSKFKYMIENNSNVTRSMYDENYAENSDDESDEEN
ncbi:hypothetical protein M8J75_002102 [Diaphorina citri]|nr:hypothetical protein M8J75_002102 [Diaphorina citri]